jgi:putative CocE/NonD family hydrolase
MITPGRALFFRALAWFAMAAALPTYGTENTKDMHIERSVSVAMRDGIHLATDIYRPARNGVAVAEPLPAILLRTPYDKSKPTHAESAAFFTRHGYVVVVQDCRGRYRSEGVFTKYVNEPEDGFDTIAWLTHQPWCNGKVGMRGSSYSAHVQAGAAKLNPPGLATIVVTVGGTSNGWTHSIRHHGAFALKQLTWAFSNLRSESDDPVVKARLSAEKIADWIQVMPWRRGQNPLSISPEFEDYILEQWTHGDYDAYWKQMGVNWVEYYNQTADIPMIHVSGWYDNYCATAIDNYVGLSRRKKSPIRLLLGPWTHSVATTSHAGEVEFGPAALLPDYHREWHLRWFDTFLKDGENALREAADVRLFVMGTGDGRRDANGRLFHGGFWIDSPSWPLRDTAVTPFYLHPDGRLRAETPAADAAAITYTFDPADPVPTIGGAFASTQPLFAGGAFDQRERPYTGDPNQGFFGSKPPYLPLKARADVLVYETEPLTEDVMIAGPVIVKLHVSSSAPDTDFTAKLIDVYPPSADYPSGFDLNLTDGILRARYRNSPERQEFMRSGETYPITIETFGTANVFKKGHRIRVDISSSNFPAFDVNPNTGEPLGQNRRQVTADNTIHHARATPSLILLPIVPLEKYRSDANR